MILDIGNRKAFVHLALKITFCDSSWTKLNFKPIEELHELLKTPKAAFAEAQGGLHQDIILGRTYHGETETGQESCCIIADFEPGDIWQASLQSFRVELLPEKKPMFTILNWQQTLIIVVAVVIGS